MKFCEISAEEFRDFADHSPYKSFMQTPEIAAYRTALGWRAHYLAVKGPASADRGPTPLRTKTAKKSQKSRSTAILAASLLVSRPNFLGQQLFYAPGGPLLDLEDTKLTNFFFTELKTYLRTHHAYALRIDPYYELIQRDRDGIVVPGGFNHQIALKNLQNLGFTHVRDTAQPRYLFALDLKNRTPDELFASFKQNTRNLIHRAERQGVKVRELSENELDLLKEITASTAQRRAFTDQPLSYYQAMFRLFHPKGEVKFLLAEVDPSSNSVKNSTSSCQLPDASDQLPSTSDQLPNTSDQPTDASDRPPTTPGPTPLSVAMFMLYGDEIIYLFSGSDSAYMKQYNAQYLIQWSMIKYAATHGFRRYNFYGIRGLPDPSQPGYGIYRFKKGFGGQVIELIGTYELAINRPVYTLHRTLARTKNLKNLLRRPQL